MILRGNGKMNDHDLFESGERTFRKDNGFKIAQWKCRASAGCLTF